MSEQPINERYSTVTSCLIVPGASELIDFVMEVFNAEEVERHMAEDSTVAHAELRIGDSVIMVGEAMEESMPGALFVCVDNVDTTYQQALEAGAESMQEPQDQFYGARVARVKDAFGNCWAIATDSP